MPVQKKSRLTKLWWFRSFFGFQIDFAWKHSLCFKWQVMIQNIPLNFAQPEAFLSWGSILSVPNTHSNRNPALLYPGLKLQYLGRFLWWVRSVLKLERRTIRMGTAKYRTANRTFSSNSILSNYNTSHVLYLMSTYSDLKKIPSIFIFWANFRILYSSWRPVNQRQSVGRARLHTCLDTSAYLYLQLH
jgi:hypothetical protein